MDYGQSRWPPNGSGSRPASWVSRNFAVVPAVGRRSSGVARQAAQATDHAVTGCDSMRRIDLSFMTNGAV
jgi:hypothetical protein